MIDKPLQVGEDKPTSLISLLSCEHGRVRREERDIGKRDLQKAIKHGTPERTYKGRIKIVYDWYTIIVDPTMRREITAYASPQKLYPITQSDRDNQEKARFITENKPELCKSHTVLVVDNSGSMQTHDIPAHRDRQIAAYTTVALDYIADQLLKKTFNDTDVVSLVEFHETAEIVFEREPCSWVLYNKLLSRREASNFVTRQDIHKRESTRADSNYLPALKLARSLLDIGHHPECALAVFFLSDGEPSDARQNGWTTLHAQSQILAAVREMSASYPDALSLKTVGFGNPAGDFSTLEAMAKACNQVTGSDRATFVYCEKLAHTLGKAASSLATSLSETRTSLLSHGKASTGEKRNVPREKETGILHKWRFYKILDHRVFDPRRGRLETVPGIPLGALDSDGPYRTQEREPNYLAMNVSSCGSGAERVAFRCFLANGRSPHCFVYGSMVAKETNLVQRMREVEKFHRAFCEAQGLASFLAEEFNRYVRDATSQSPKSCVIPAVSFLPCSVLLLEDGTISEKGRSVLVEKKLNTERFQWSKWNDNSGGVEGRAYHPPLDIEYEYNSIINAASKVDRVPFENEFKSIMNAPTFKLDYIEEDSEEEDSDDESQDDFIPPSAYLQAFSHFTYIHTCRKLLVCDLQGIYNTDTVPPTFELTDPAIHYRSSQGRKHVYGYTDKGDNGVERFFESHRCNGICRLLKLSAKNLDRRTENWRRDWCKRHGEKLEAKPVHRTDMVLREKVNTTVEKPVDELIKRFSELKLDQSRMGTSIPEGTVSDAR